MRFVDTNVLIYAASPSADEAGKRRRAQHLLREGGLVVSVQVLQKFYSQVTRPSRADPLARCWSAWAERWGAAAGTGPDGDPWLGAQRREARAEGHAEGRAAGRAEACVEMVRSILETRGLAVSERLAARIAGEDPAALAAAASSCRDEPTCWPASMRDGLLAGVTADTTPD